MLQNTDNTGNQSEASFLNWTGLPFNIGTKRIPQLLNLVSLYFIINGNWGEWGILSKCSKTCGVGEHSRTRKCDNPAPAHGGKDCEGAFRQRRLCNKNKCPGKTKVNLNRVKLIQNLRHFLSLKLQWSDISRFQTSFSR